jgi:transcriptional regulator with XRE-family HTH domain
MTKLLVGPGEEDNVQFGNMMARFRTAAKFTRAEAGKAFGFTSEYIRLIERGKRVPAAGNMRRILNVYGVDCEEIEPGLIILGDFSIEFTSRILEPRGFAPIRSAKPKIVSKRRAKKIGKIVECLLQKDDETIDKLYIQLMQGE